MGPEIGTCIGIDASVVWMSSSFGRRDCEIFILQFVIRLRGKGYRGPDSESCLDGALKAFRGTLEVSAHSDNPLRSYHLEYNVRVVWNSHEFL
jgi:hypothetical protein